MLGHNGLINKKLKRRIKMKKSVFNVIMVICISFLYACGEAVYDTSSAEAKKESLNNIAKTMTEDEKKDFSETLTAMYILSDFMLEVSKKEADLILDKELHGKTAKEIISIFNAKNERSKQMFKK